MFLLKNLGELPNLRPSYEAYHAGNRCFVVRDEPRLVTFPNLHHRPRVCVRLGEQLLFNGVPQVQMVNKGCTLNRPPETLLFS